MAKAGKRIKRAKAAFILMASNFLLVAASGILEAFIGWENSQVFGIGTLVRLHLLINLASFF